MLSLKGSSNKGESHRLMEVKTGPGSVLRISQPFESRDVKIGSVETSMECVKALLATELNSHDRILKFKGQLAQLC